MQTFNRLYQLDHPRAPWHTFCYTIKSEDIPDIPLYRVRRSRFRKYQQFEDIDNNQLFYIGAITIKSVDNNETLATVKMINKTIETMIGSFTLTDLDISRRSYILKMNDKMVAQVTSKCSVKHNEHIIELIDIYKQHHAFIFSILTLIDSILERIRSPMYHLHPLYIPQFTINSTPSYSSHVDCFRQEHVD